MYKFVVAAFLLALPLSASNPFTHHSVSVYAGYEGGGSISVRDRLHFLQIGGIESGNLGVAFDFATAGGADDTGGFMLYMGPRFNTSYQAYVTVDFLLGIVPTQASKGILWMQDIDMSIKPLYSFQLGSGYIAPSVNFLIGFSGGVSGQGLIGGSFSILPGVQHYFSEHVGWFAELGVRYQLLRSISGQAAVIQNFAAVLNAGMSYAF